MIMIKKAIIHKCQHTLIFWFFNHSIFFCLFFKCKWLFVLISTTGLLPPFSQMHFCLHSAKQIKRSPANWWCLCLWRDDLCMKVCVLGRGLWVEVINSWNLYHPVINTTLSTTDKQSGSCLKQSSSSSVKPNSEYFHRYDITHAHT